MAMQGFFSQLLGAGAGKSMADYNKQQQINQLLREGWVPKGQGGIPDQPMEEEQPAEGQIEYLDQTGSESGDLDAMMRMAEAIGDPELVKIINEMFSPDTAEDLTSQRFQGEPPEGVESPMSRLDTSAIEGGFGFESPIEDTSNYRGGLLSPANQDQGTPYGLRDDPASTEKPSLAPDGKRWTWSIDDNGWELSDAMPVSDTNLVNPDPESRAFISEKFAPMREKLTGLVPSGKSVGGFLKPVAEQLNAMFGSSTPLDMDGYEMGPYHAQRIQHEQGQLDERSRRDMVKRDEMQRDQWNAKNEIDRDAIRQRLIGNLLTYASSKREQGLLRKLDALEAQINAKPKIDPDQALTPEEMEAYQPRIESLVSDLGDILDESGWADWSSGYHAFSLDWWYEDFDTIMKGINLMMGLTQEGAEPTTPEEIEASTEYITEPSEQRKIVEILGRLNYIHGLIYRSEEIRYRAMTGEDIPYSEWRDIDREAQMLKTLEAVLKRWKSKASGKTGNVDEDGLARQANGRPE